MAGVGNDYEPEKTEAMTVHEFDKQGFVSGDKARYRDGKVYEVAMVDFDERLIGLLMHIEGGGTEDISWVRCESVDYIPCGQNVKTPNNGTK